MNSRFKERFKDESGKIEQFYGRWKVDELAVFGSILTNEFADNSDIGSQRRQLE